MIDDGDAAHVVVDGIIDIFRECCSACSDYDRAFCYVGYAQVNLSCVVTFVAASQEELVVLGDLFCYGFGAVVEFTEAVFVGQGWVSNPFCEVFAKGFCYGEDDATFVDGVAFHEVELSVGMWVVLSVESVQVEGSQEDGVLEAFFWQVAEIDACRVALVFDVESELVGHHFLCAEVIDVLHHQSPCGQVGAS